MGKLKNNQERPFSEEVLDKALKEWNLSRNETAFKILYKHHFMPSVYFVLNRLDDREIALGIVSDSFASVYRYETEIKNFRGFLFTVITNRINAYFRKKHTRIKIVSMETLPKILDAQVVFNEYDLICLLKEYDKFLQLGLSEEQALYMVLIKNEFSVKEITEMTKNKEKLIKKQIKLAAQLLEKMNKNNNNGNIKRKFI